MKQKLLSILALAFLVGVTLASPARAGIIKVQAVQTCSVVGLDTSTSSVTGGVHCADAAGDSFSLTDILNGSIGLLVGNSQTPSWNIVNDTGSSVTSLALYYSGALAPNANIDMQVGGGYFTTCTSNDGVHVNTDTNCGTGDITVKPQDGGLLPVLLTWSSGTGLAVGQNFNLGTASFAHAGQDAGCFSGTANCGPANVPEPSVLSLLGIGLLGLGFLGRRRVA